MVNVVLMKVPDAEMNALAPDEQPEPSTQAGRPPGNVLPPSSGVLVAPPGHMGPIFTGDEGHNYLCAECEFTLAEKLPSFLLQGMIFRCPRCQTYNRARI